MVMLLRYMPHDLATFDSEAIDSEAHDSKAIDNFMPSSPLMPL